ncbi:MAG: Txe/YoeB family addiction module toxin [Chloroflexota bacterium]
MPRKPKPKKDRATAVVNRSIVVDPNFLDDLRYWSELDRDVTRRVFQLIEATLRDPFQGLGKPEPLRGSLAGAWSRRVTQEHRLIYVVHDDRIIFVQCRYHYEK